MLRKSQIIMLTVLMTSLSVGAAEKDLYDFLWLDPDKSVYVLQNKVFEKEHSFYLNAGFLRSSSADFQKTTGFGARAGFYLREDWAIEGFYHQLDNSNDEAFDNIRQGNSVLPFVRRVNNYYGAMAVWAPFYGKINTFNKIIYFDLVFGLGASKINAESNTDSFRNSSAQNVYEEESFTALTWKSELRVYINKKWHVGLGLYNNHYKAKGGLEKSKESFRRHTDGSLSVGFSF